MVKPLRVLHVIQNLNYGGMERLVADMVRLADPVSIDPHVLVLQYSGRFSQDLGDRATLHRAPPSGPLSMLRPVGLARAISQVRPDVVHLHSGVWYKGSLAARQAHVPSVIHTEHGRHDPDPLQARLLDGLASRRTDVAVAVSESVAGLLERRVVRGRCRVEVVRNGVDTDVHRPRERTDSDQLREALGIAPSTPVIGSVGRLEPIKGYDLMIRAFELLLDRIPQEPLPVLVLAGDGSEAGKLREMVRTGPCANRIHLLGWRDDVGELLSLFSFFSMSSRSEGTSVSLLEAMSSGLCPVVTDVGGNREVLGPELSHRLVAPNDPDQLARAWERILTNPARMHGEGRTARQRVERCYSLRNMVEEYTRIYNETATH